MNIEEIYKSWEIDCKINTEDLGESSRQSSILHAKYLKLYSLSKLQLKRAENKQKTLLKQKWLYYNGKMTQEELEASGWEFDPFNGLKVLKGEMNYYYDADTDIQASEDKINYMKIVIETLKEIIDNLKWRHQTVRNILEFKKFQSGD